MENISQANRYLHAFTEEEQPHLVEQPEVVLEREKKRGREQIEYRNLKDQTHVIRRYGTWEFEGSFMRRPFVEVVHYFSPSRDEFRHGQEKIKLF